MIIHSVQKALLILSTLADAKNRPLTLAQISDTTGIGKPGCCHMLSTMIADGYVQRVSHSKGYILGPATFCLSRYGKYGDELVALCHPVMEWLHEKTGETIILSVIQGSRKYNIDYIDVDHAILKETAEILPDEIYRTATGRVMLANASHTVVREIYTRCGPPPTGHWDAVTDYDSLLDELHKIDKRGVLCCGTPRPDGTVMMAYAAGLFRRSTCVGAVGIAIREPVSPDGVVEDEEIKKKLLRATREISSRLAFN